MDEWEQDSPRHVFDGLMGICYDCGYESYNWRHTPVQIHREDVEKTRRRAETEPKHANWFWCMDCRTWHTL